MNGEGSYFLVKFCRLDDSGVKVLEDMLGERVECRLKIDWGGIFVARDALRSESRGFVDNAYTFRPVGQDASLLGAKLREAVSESLGGLFELEVSTISAEELASERQGRRKKIFSRPLRCAA